MTPQKNTIYCGGNLEVVASWPSNCIDSICTDPPYGLGFMGKEWDTLIEKTRDSAGGFLRDGKSGSNPYAAARCRHGSDSLQMQEWYYHWAKAMLRITKPGGFLLCFGGTRTFHRLACAIEDAGWEIRDCMSWFYGSGFPKSHNISKAVDKAARGFPQGTNRTDPSNPNAGKYKTQRTEGKRSSTDKGQHFGAGPAQFMAEQGEKQKDAPITPLAQLWNGYGTALKPAWEPIIVAMKPLDGTFAHNAERHGVAGLNIDAARIGTDGRPKREIHSLREDVEYHGSSLCGRVDGSLASSKAVGSTTQGRWPANLILDEEAAHLLDEQTGTKKSGFMAAGTKRQMSDNPNKNTYGKFNPDTVRNDTYGDSGGTSRFFYCAKCSRRERNMGLDDQSGKKVNDGRQTPIDNPYQRGETIRKNTHPTVKPLALMKYLCTLLKMPGSEQIILDPFMGSGTTGIACKELGIGFIGIEKEREYCEIAVKRIAAVEGQEITLETTLPVTKNVETVRRATGFVSGGGSPNENSPHVSENRQRIINAAVAALREKRK